MAKELPPQEQKIRLFLALNLPEDLKERLAVWQKKHMDLPVRWVRKEDLHLTVLFLGWIEAEALPEVERGVANAATSFPPFSIHFTGIDYGPPDGPKSMLWLYGLPILELPRLKRALELEMTRRTIPFTPETRELIPHVTLGRIHEEEWRRKIGSKIPPVSEALDNMSRYEQLELMQSHLTKAGSTYTIVQSFPFSGESSIA